MSEETKPAESAAAEQKITPDGVPVWDAIIIPSVMAGHLVELADKVYSINDAYGPHLGTEVVYIKNLQTGFYFLAPTPDATLLFPGDYPLPRVIKTPRYDWTKPDKEGRKWGRFNEEARKNRQ